MAFGKHTIYPVYRLNADLTTTPVVSLPQYFSAGQMFEAPDGQIFLTINGSSYSDAGFYCTSGDGLNWVRYHDTQLQGIAIEGVIDNNGYIYSLIFDSSMRGHLYKSADPVF
jgi:hypothetical protein